MSESVRLPDPSERRRTTIPRPTVEVYKRGRAFGWKFFVNGRVMAQSTGTYSRRRQAWRAFDHFRAHVATTGYKESTQGVDGRIA